MAVTKVGTVIAGGDTASFTTRNTGVAPTLSDGDMAIMFITGGANTWTHVPTTPGVTWTLIGYQNSVSGHLSSAWYGKCATAASTNGQATTIIAQDATPATVATKLDWEIQWYHGMDNTGTNGANFVHQSAGTVSAASSTNITSPATPATTVPNCVTITSAHYSMSAIPVPSNITFDGGASDGFASTGTTATSLHCQACITDLTPLSVGATPGGKVAALFDATPASRTGTPRSSWTLALAPALAAPTATASASNTDPATGVSVVLTGVPVGTVTSRLWSQLSGPASPTINNATTNVADFTPTVGGTYVFRFVATNGAGSSTPVDITIYVHELDSVQVLNESVTMGVFTTFGGGTGIDNVNDASDTTGVQNSGVLSHTDKVTIVKRPFGLGVITIRVRVRYQTTAATARALVYKADGTTLIYTQADWALTTSFTDKDIVLDSTALAAIPLLSDRRALVVKLSAA